MTNLSVPGPRFGQRMRGKRRVPESSWVRATRRPEIVRFPASPGGPPERVEEWIHQTLITHGVPGQESELVGSAGRPRLAAPSLPDSWASNVTGALELIDHLDEEISEKEPLPHQVGSDHPHLPLLMSAPGWAECSASRSHRRLPRSSGFAGPEEGDRLHRFVSLRRPVRRVRLPRGGHETEV